MNRNGRDDFVIHEAADEPIGDDTYMNNNADNNEMNADSPYSIGFDESGYISSDSSAYDVDSDDEDYNHVVDPFGVQGKWKSVVR